MGLGRVLPGTRALVGAPSANLELETREVALNIKYLTDAVTAVTGGGIAIEAGVGEDKHRRRPGRR